MAEGVKRNLLHEDIAQPGETQRCSSPPVQVNYAASSSSSSSYKEMMDESSPTEDTDPEDSSDSTLVSSNDYESLDEMVQRPAKKQKTNSHSQSKATLRKPLRNTKFSSAPNNAATKRVTTSNTSIEIPDSEEDPENDWAQRPTINTINLHDDQNNGKEIKRKEDKFTFKCGFQAGLAPLSKNEDFFRDLIGNAWKHIESFLLHMGNRPLAVGTFCSGTESPILALEMFAKHIGELCKKSKTLNNAQLNVAHKFSFEIVPFKQSYIQTNFEPEELFRDVLDVSVKREGGKIEAITALGSKKTVAGNLDILIAGTCCVDFSNLNVATKSIEAGGESGDTFLALRDYCQKSRPRLLITENVKGAPWLQEQVNEDNWENENVSGNGKTAFNEYMRKIGYACQFASLDSSDYYIPQTRLRGYMVCVDVMRKDTVLSREELIAWNQKSGKKWLDMMSLLKRQNSIPYESMLFEHDSHRIPRGLDLSASSNTVHDWSTCFVRHQQLRHDLELGEGRPFTSWQNGGATIFPDNSDNYVPTLGERVFDFLDLSYLRAVRRGYDQRYVSRCIDVSQNIDMQGIDTISSGRAPCITPSGMFVHTSRFGGITGPEVVALQGLPIERLDFNRLSSKQIRDLAGNAMSSTVVGACILAAFAVFYRELEPGPKVLKRVDHKVDHLLQGEAHLTTYVANPHSYKTSSTSALRDFAALTARYCLCENTSDLHRLPVQKCTVCGHTTHVRCGQKPRHSYVTLSDDLVASRLEPSKFATLLLESLPKKIRFSQLDLKNVFSIHQAHIQKPTQDLIIQPIEQAFTSELCLQKIHRGETWKVYYESGSAQLILHISEHDVEWNLFAKPGKNVKNNDAVRAYLQYPIARMFPTSTDLLDGDWDFWLPQESTFQATLTGYGLLVPSFENKIGMPQHSDDYVSAAYKLELPKTWNVNSFGDLSGDYELSQNCGMPFDSFHIKKDTKGTISPLYFFLDQESVGQDPKDSKFVFTHDRSQHTWPSKRQVLASLTSDWRQQKFQLVKSSKHAAERIYQVESDQVEENKLDRIEKINLKVRGKWTRVADISFCKNGNDDTIQYRQLPKQPLSLSSGCSTKYAALICDARLPKDIQPRWSPGEWVKLTKSTELDIKDELLWMLAQGKKLSCHVESSGNWQRVCTRQNPDRCVSCAPYSPKILWKIKNGKQIPFEDPKEAAAYERSLKARPRALEAFYNFDATKHSLHMKVGFNPQTLLHQAEAALLENVGNHHDVEVMHSYRLVTDDASDRKAEVKVLSLKDCEDEMDLDTVLPATFRGVPREEQKKELSWMLAQENNPPIFVREEVKEQRIQSLGYRLEARASMNCSARGGICSDHIGFGKTLMQLMLHSVQLSKDMEAANEDIPGMIPLRATIIFVPAHLTGQWRSEAERFLGYRQSDILVVNRIDDFNRKSVSDFQQASLIIVNWRVCESAGYALRVAQFAGLVEPAENAGLRATATWYKQAREKILSNVDELRNNPTGMDKHLLRQYEEHMQQTQNVDIPVPSKRVRGAQYLASKERKALGTETIPKLSADMKLKPRKDVFGFQKLRHWTKMTSPIFEMFRFARVIVDEFTYLDTTSQAALVVQNLYASARWALSGTPPLGNLQDIKNMAQWVGLDLGRTSQASMNADQIKSLEKDSTSRELYLAQFENPSSTFLERDNEVAQMFCDLYVRQNTAKIPNIDFYTHYVLTRQSAYERAHGIEFASALQSCDFQMANIKRSISYGSSRSQQLTQDVKTCEDSEQAFLIQAGVDTSYEKIKSYLKTCPSTCESNLRVRQNEYEEFWQKFQDSIAKATWLQNATKNHLNDRLDMWKARLRSNAFGDQEVTTRMINCVDDAERHVSYGQWNKWYHPYGLAVPDNNGGGGDSRKPYPMGKSQKSQYKNLSNKEVELRLVVTALTKQGNELVTRKRYLRYLEVLCSLLKGQEVICGGCDEINPSLPDITIFSTCGHTVCKKCYIKFSPIEDCPIESCSASSKSFEQIRIGYIGDQSTDAVHGPYFGQKISDLVDLIKNIRRHYELSKTTGGILLFVQYDEIRTVIEEAFTEFEIGFTFLDDSNKSSDALNAWQSGRDDTQVLLLKLGDASASGANLTRANHVIFYHPYHIRGVSAQAAYRDQKLQAIGRARRHGQKHDVHVYEMLSSNTIDVDIIQMRTGKILKEVETPAAAQHQPFPGFESKLGLAESIAKEEGEYSSLIASRLFPAGYQY
ncbi:hypothetical protein BP5796_01808 [Coleophoma crateriformis]|uniref:RING-type domain-containing protein n=1 Tax=Coleophoma crateriformis TaxID=565419 RepID=A0A3D8T1K2_9HELO|nr:hypothetical protein BP5796_01808 [Coleophoma crateriformis]